MTRDTRTFVNTFHVAKNTAWTLPNMQTLAQVFVDWWTTNYRVFVWTGVNLIQVQVRLYNPANPLAFDQTVSPPVPGLTANPPNPGNATVSASWRTGLAGRKYRGRFYTVGLCEGQTNDNDTVSTTYVLQAGTAMTQLLANLVAQTFALVIFHRVDNTATAVISSILENIVDSQRRRLPARGR